MGTVNLKTASGGSVILSPANTAVDTTITVPAISAPMAINGPAFSAYASTNQSVSANTATKVLFDTELFDTNNSYATSRFTPTVAGYYSVYSNMYASGTMSNTQISFFKNGAVYSTPIYISASYIMQGASDLVYCNGTTDYIEVYFTNQNAATIGGASGSAFVRFSAAMVRSA